jgi:hypothetical protein
MSTKSYIHEMYGTLKKMSFCTKGCAEIHIQRPFFDIEKGIWKILRLKIQMVCSCFGAPSTNGSFVLGGKPKSQFLVEFQVFELIVFSKILAILGSFREIWANFSTLAAANSMPKLHLKS